METWTLRVVEIRVEAREMKTIFLQRADGQPLAYRAGQFLTLLFVIHDRELRRSYSFSTTPGIDPVPGITVKRVPNGEISRYLLDRLSVGDTLTALPAAGRFTLGAAAGIHFFIAAGSGIVPVFSLIKEALAEQPATRVVMISQQHDMAAVPFGAALQALAAQYDASSGGSGRARFLWISLLSIREGRLNNQWLEEWIVSLLPTGDFERVNFYLCGPAAFMRMAQFTLRLLGIAEERIKKEFFTAGPAPAPPLLTDRSPRQVRILTSSGIREFIAAWPDTILTAAQKQGIPLPYSCRAGRCSSCVAKCIKGRVKMSVNEVLTDRDLQDGLVLTCVGYAETDVELWFGTP
jgi:ring-1,2-phenylacetyl-CoA epoxidase subunit PaaE